MINYFRRKFNPEIYQGLKKKSHYFEGWYYKIINAHETCLLAVIPGVSIDDKSGASHAFIQILNGDNNQSYYYEFPMKEFFADKKSLDIRIGSNRITKDYIILDLQNKPFNIKGEIYFKNLSEWPKTLLSPGIMGWYSWIPFMECNHGVVSMDHGIEGRLSINGKNVEFTGGRGYTEKDWGVSFPEAWIWVQSNHFERKNISFMGSVAIIPWIRRPFLGMIFGLWYEGILYRFTTYTGARLHTLKIKENQIHCIVKQKKLSLDFTIYPAEGAILQAPTLNGMDRRMSESMKSTVELTLSRHSEGIDRILFQGTGRHAGFEIAGDIERLLNLS